MPIWVIHNLWAVGMHHWGPKELVVAAGYRLKHEEDNAFDKNATAILTDQIERLIYNGMMQKLCHLCLTLYPAQIGC